MTRTNRLYILLLLLCVPFLYESTQAADPTSKDDNWKVDSLNKLAFNQKHSQVAFALQNLFVAENMAVTAKYQKGLGINYLYQAGIFHQMG